MSDPALQALGQRAAALLPRAVVVAAARPCDPATLHAEERAGIAAAIPARQREFAGGRAAARIAQHVLTGAARPVLMGPDRAPVWPQGLRGAITHAGDLCLSAVTDDPAIAALGIDLEPDDPLPPEVLAEVLLPGDDPQHARLVFSAKETVFKALYPRVGHVFGFDAVRITLSEGRFTATTVAPLGPVPTGAELSGRFWWGEGLILTALAL